MSLELCPERTNFGRADFGSKVGPRSLPSSSDAGRYSAQIGPKFGTHKVMAFFVAPFTANYSFYVWSQQSADLWLAQSQDSGSRGASSGRSSAQADWGVS